MKPTLSNNRTVHFALNVAPADLFRSNLLKRTVLISFATEKARLLFQYTSKPACLRWRHGPCRDCCSTDSCSTTTAHRSTCPTPLPKPQSPYRPALSGAARPPGDLPCSLANSLSGRHPTPFPTTRSARGFPRISAVWRASIWLCAPSLR
jgi:hypothetical protein